MSDIKTIAVLTCDRPAALARCLESYSQNALSHGRQVRFLIADDSKDHMMRTKIKEMLRAFKAKTNHEVLYGGYEEKRAFATALAHDDLALKEVLEFALFDPLACGRTTGANRNSLLLQTAGTSFLSVDDDTLGEVWGPVNTPPEKAVLQFVGDPTEQWAFPDELSLGKKAHPVNVDVWKDLDQCLGQPLKEFVKAAAPDVTRLNLGQITRVAQSRGRILGGWIGICGDSGYRYPSHLLWLTGASRDFLVQDESSYIERIKNRLLLRLPGRKAISPAGYFQSTAIGLCNNDLLPPFMPVYRGQDMIFGATFSACFNDDWVAYMPYAIRHCPMPTRQNKQEDIIQPATFIDFHPVVLHFMQSFKLTAVGSEERLKQLGKHLTETGAMPLAQFEEIVKSGAQMRAQNTIKALNDLLRRYGSQPSYWANDLQRYKTTLQQSLSSANYFVPSEMEGQSDCMQRIQELLTRWGTLLFHWPTIVQKAKILQTKGTSLAQPL